MAIHRCRILFVGLQIRLQTSHEQVNTSRCCLTRLYIAEHASTHWVLYGTLKNIRTTVSLSKTIDCRSTRSLWNPEFRFTAQHPGSQTYPDDRGARWPYVRGCDSAPHDLRPIPTFNLKAGSTVVSWVLNEHVAFLTFMQETGVSVVTDLQFMFTFLSTITTSIHWT